MKFHRLNGNMVSFGPPPIFSHLANAFALFSTLVIEMQDRLKYPYCTIWGGENGVCVPNRSRLYISKVFFGLVEERAKSFYYTRTQELPDFLSEMMFVEAKVGHISDYPDHWSWCHDHAPIDWLSAGGSFIEHPLRSKEMGDWRLTMLEHFSYSGTHNINLRAGRHIDIIQYMQESRKQLPLPTSKCMIFHFSCLRWPHFNDFFLIQRWFSLQLAGGLSSTVRIGKRWPPLTD